MVNLDEGQQDFTPEQKRAVEVLRESIKVFLESDEVDFPKSLYGVLWDALLVFQNYPFSTVKKLSFSYMMKGNELFVIRRDKEIVWEKKSITRATVELAFFNAMTLQKSGEYVTGPKKLRTFGASYLYPVFIQLGAVRLKP